MGDTSWISASSQWLLLTSVFPKEFPLILTIYSFLAPFWSSPSSLFMSVSFTHARDELLLNHLSQFWRALCLPNHSWDVCVGGGVVERDCQPLAQLGVTKVGRATKFLEAVCLFKEKSLQNCVLKTVFWSYCSSLLLIGYDLSSCYFLLSSPTQFALFLAPFLFPLEFPHHSVHLTASSLVPLACGVGSDWWGRLTDSWVSSYLIFCWSSGLMGLSVPSSQEDQSSCWLANCTVTSWELLSEQVHFQPPGLFGLLLIGDLFPSCPWIYCSNSELSAGRRI